MTWELCFLGILTPKKLIDWSETGADVESTPRSIDPGPGEKSGGFVSWETIFGSCSWDIEHDNARCDGVNSLMLVRLVL